MTADPREADIARFTEDNCLAYIRLETIHGDEILVLHDGDGDPLAMSATVTGLISFAANRGMTVCTVH